MIRRPAVPAIVVALFLAVLAGPGCSGQNASGPSSGAGGQGGSAEASGAAAWRAQAEAVGAALREWGVSNLTSSYEPAGNIKEEPSVGTLVFARVLHVDPTGRQVTFDVEQIYIGGAADLQAKRDGKAPLESPVYVRNRYAHAQTLPLADGVLPIVQGSPISRYAGDMGAVQPKDFARLVNTPQSPVHQMGYWVSIHGGMIRMLVEEYSQ